MTETEHDEDGLTFEERNVALNQSSHPYLVDSAGMKMLNDPYPTGTVTYRVSVSNTEPLTIGLNRHQRRAAARRTGR